MKQLLFWILACSALLMPSLTLAEDPDCAFTGADCIELPAPTPPIPAPPTDIGSLVLVLIDALPAFITAPLTQLLSSLVLIASVLMLILRVLMWILPSKVTRWLTPVANALHWLTWLVDRLALNSGRKK